jgi:alpha-beta hydrolase superfamily lysophospholipase
MTFCSHCSQRTAKAGVLALAVALAASLTWQVEGLHAQPSSPDDQPARAEPGGRGEKLPLGGKDLVLETRDGVQLHVEYRRPMVKKGTSKDIGKDVVPVVLLHMAKGSGADWKPLADALQRAGHAVIVPDLRGHGKSTEVKRGGRTLAIDQATMRPGDFAAMVTQDMERIKKFIVEENNAGQLNLRKLCLVGAEMGAAVAVNWAAMDWSWPPLATGPQGQDVNGLVLISPVWQHKGMTIVDASNHPAIQGSIATAIIVGGKNAASLREAQRLNGILERHHEDYSKAPEQVKRERQTLFFKSPPTSLQGTKMLGERSLGVEGLILTFIHSRLVKQGFPWAMRHRPLE